MTKIEWTHREGTKGETWNVTVGCSKVSPGCQHCYAEKMALRLAHMALADIEAGRDPGRKRHYLDVVDLERRCWNGQIKLVPEALKDPSHWRKPRTVFVDSMSDLFHKDVPSDYICDVFYEMARTPNHTYIVLTKRSKRMFEWFNRPEAQDSKWHKPLPNVIGMVTVENQEQADKRIPMLLRCPFAILGVSIEPMLDDIRLDDVRETWYSDGPSSYKIGEWSIDSLRDSEPLFCEDLVHRKKLDWVIVGAETGPGRREMKATWARDIRDQCKSAGVPFFFKSMGNGPAPDDLKIREWPEVD